LPLTESGLYRVGLLIHLMDEALSRLPPVAGTFRRGIDPSGLGERRTDFLKAHTRRGRIVAWEGYTSVMDGEPYEGRAQFILHIRSARDLREFSVKGEHELILPRSTRIRIIDYRVESDYYVIEAEETDDERPIRRDNRFHVE